MSKKLHVSGEPAPASGQYPVVGPKGGDKGYEITIKKGAPLPPVPEKGWGFGKPDLTKHKK
jgi:hypothetical protein